MKTRVVIFLSVLFLLFSVGIAGAQFANQQLLAGKSIPKFVDPLPQGDLTGATGITVLDATVPAGASPTIAAAEFLAQILPTGYPASWVWGYRVPGVDYNAAKKYTPDAVIRDSYLGPVVIAKKGLTVNPSYQNWLPHPDPPFNGSPSNVLPNLPIDQTLDWADPLGDVCVGANIVARPECIAYVGAEIPIATHLHGGEVAPSYDGGPDAWFTQDALVTGPGFPGPTYTYPNDQQEGTIWFHDHALGITRLNVYAGLAGVYPIVDPGGLTAPVPTMPTFPTYDIPLIIQDRSFDTNGQIFYNLASNPQPNPTVHPFWIPEFIGDTIVVNGKTWPFLSVEPRQYRFRFVNGSNARFYDLTLNKVKATKSKKGGTANLSVDKTPVLPFIVIATDDGYLNTAVSTANLPGNNLIIGPGERYEVIVDFSQFGDVNGTADGTQIIMMNSARTPFPAGAKVTNNGTDRVMLFNVNINRASADVATINDGATIRQVAIKDIKQGHDTYSGETTGMITRQLTLNEVIGGGGPLELVINNSKFNEPDILPGCTTPLCRESELPQVGDTEIWEIINISADAHPMHTHLTSFQIIDRTPFNAAAWITQYDALLFANGVFPGHGPPYPYNVINADGAIGGNPPVWNGPHPGGTPPLLYEQGWKDTAIMYPGEVTRIVIRWAETDATVRNPATDCGVPAEGCPGFDTYPFDPTALEGPVGYVWHCHIIDHEDNEMMRNYVVGTARQPVVP